ncbi:MAG: DNA-formamidopyrimidine glycosylase family protein [Micropruina glycogenica]
MPEGDTVWRTAQRLNQVFAGHILTRCDLRWPELSTLDFTGHTTTEVISRGKHLLHRLDSGWTIHSHLRMEGQWRIEPPGTRANAQTRALLATHEWTALGQRLGMLDVVRTDAERTLVGHLGPDVLGPTGTPSQPTTWATPTPSAPPCSTRPIWPASAPCTHRNHCSCSASTR